MELNKENQQDLRSFLVQVYGPQANAWPMTLRMVNLTIKLVEKSDAASELVDRPWMLPGPRRAASKWLSSQQIGSVLRKLSWRKRHYATRVKKPADNLKHKFYLEAKAN